MGLILLLCFCCENKKKITPETLENRVKEVNLIEDNELIINEKIPFDWGNCKKNIRFLNCSSSINQEKNYLVVPKDSIGFLYGYCLHNGNQHKDDRNDKYKNSEKIIEAITFKRGKKIGDYLDKNENLLFIKSKESNKYLGTFDIVGEEKRQLDKLISMNRKDIGDFAIYNKNAVRLICKFDENEKVEWFKYYFQFSEESDKEFNKQPLFKW